MFSTKIIEKFANQLENPARLKHVLFSPTAYTREIKVVHVRDWGYWRKIIIDDGKNRYLVYASLYPKYIRKIIRLLTMLTENKVNIPPVQALHAGVNSFIKNRGCYLVQEYVSGERAGNYNNYQTTQSIAENIGRIHAITATKPNYLLKTNKSIKRITSQPEYAWQNMLKLMGEYPEFIYKLPAKQYSHWFAEKKAIFNQQGPFYLLHGDLSPGNIIIRENNQAFILDYDGMHYGYPGLELFRCLMANYCRHSLEHQLLFLETYRHNVPQESWLLWGNNMSAMAGFGILKRMTTWFKSSQKLLEKGEVKKSRIKLAQSLDYWNWLQDIIVTFPDGKGDWSSVMALYPQKNTVREKRSSVSSLTMRQ